MGVLIMLKKMTTILAASLLLGGCVSQPKDTATFTPSAPATSTKKGGVKELQLSVIKLYAKSNIDSGIIIEQLNKDLSEGQSINTALGNFGTYFTDVKISINAVDDTDFNLVSTTTTAHVAKITANEIIPGYYNTGVEGNFKINEIDNGRYVFSYKLKNSTLKKLDVSPTNKMVTIPDIKTRLFEQSLILENNINMATGIANPEPKQYELYIVKISNKGEK